MTYTTRYIYNTMQ